MNNKVIIGIIVLVLLIGVGFIVSSNKKTASSPPSAVMTPQKQNTITLTSAGFSPGTLTIKAGDTVTWVNKSGTDATINSSPHPVHTDYPPLNLGAFPNGGILTLAFPKAGIYKYHNHLNPSEVGNIVVQ